jgi:hypothetical protein
MQETQATQVTQITQGTQVTQATRRIYETNFGDPQNHNRTWIA